MELNSNSSWAIEKYTQGKLFNSLGSRILIYTTLVVGGVDMVTCVLLSYHYGARGYYY